MIELYAEDGHSSHHHQQRTGLGLGPQRLWSDCGVLLVSWIFGKFLGTGESPSHHDVNG